MAETGQARRIVERSVRTARRAVLTNHFSLEAI